MSWFFFFLKMSSYETERQTISDTVPNDFQPLAFTPLCIPSPWVRTRLTGRLLIKRIWQIHWNVTLKLWLQKDCGFHVGHLLSLFLRAFALGEVSCYVVSSRMVSQSHMGRNWCLCSTARKIWGLSTADLPPVKPWMNAALLTPWLQPVRHSPRWHPAMSCSDFWPTDTVR